MRKKIVLLMFIMLPVFMAACRRAQGLSEGGTASGSPDNAGEARTVYVPEFSKIKYGLDKNIIIRSAPDMFIQDGMLYLVVQKLYETKADKQDVLLAIDPATGEQTERELGINGSRYFKTADGFITYANYQLRVYDKDFNSVEEIELLGFNADIQAEGKRLGSVEAVMDANGYVAIINNGNELYILNREGKLVFSMERTPQVRRFEGLAVTGAGSIVIFFRNEEYRLEAHYIDIENQTFGGKLENMPKDSIVRACPADGNGLYILTESRLYLYEPETAECSELFCMTDYGIAMDDYSTGFGIMSDGNPGIVNWQEPSESGMDRAENEVELAVLVKTPDNEVEARTELVLAAFREFWLDDYKKLIMEFNRYNPDYYITVKLYHNLEDSGVSYEVAQQQFANDLINGNAADIFWIGEGVFNLENLAEKGAISDLYEFMENDGELSREDFIPNILTAMEQEGKLYAIAPGFYLVTIVGKKELLENYSQWDFATMKELLLAHPDAALTKNTPEGFLSMFIGYSMKAFYDMKTGECSFDSPEFVTLLELAELSPKECDYSASIPSELQKEEVLLYQTALMNYYDIQIIETLFGGAVVYAGYPAKEECKAVIRCDFRLAISEQSEHKQGAWEFVKSCYTEDYQKSMPGFSVIRQYFEDGIEQEMQKSSTNVYGFMEVRIPIDPLTGERAQTLRSLVYSADTISDYDAAIGNIILEEAQAFFAGDKTAEETARLIQDRVQIYVDEKR